MINPIEGFEAECMTISTIKVRLLLQRIRSAIWPTGALQCRVVLVVPFDRAPRRRPSEESREDHPLAPIGPGIARTRVAA